MSVLHEQWVQGCDTRNTLQGEVLVSPLNASSIILRVLISCYSPLIYGSEDMIPYQ